MVPGPCPGDPWPPAAAVLRARSAALRPSTWPPGAAALPPSNWRRRPWWSWRCLELYQNQTMVQKPKQYLEKPGKLENDWCFFWGCWEFCSRLDEDIYIIYIYDGLSKCLFPVLLINRNSMRAASCLPLKNITYLDDVKTWKFFVAFGNLSKTTGIG